MLHWVHSAVAVALLTGAAPSPAPEDGAESPQEPGPPDSGRSERLAQAEAAWNEANWVEVRELLEPIAENETLEDPIERERVLLTLADATVQDTTLHDDDRQVRAGDHLLALMDADPDWRLKKNVYSPELYDVYLDKREQRLSQTGSRCRARLNACTADIDTAEATIATKEEEYVDLKEKYDTQDVYVGVKRSRGLALFPLGVSHFLNAGRLRGEEATPRVKWDRALGATFLTLEAAFGIAGLALLAYRVTADGCNRTRGFQIGSLVCDPRTGSSSEADVVRRRIAEEGMAWAFLGTVALDIVLAQIRFDDFRLEYKQSRTELEKERAGGRRRRRRAGKPRAKVRPAPAFIPSGAGAGVNVRF